jgi:hypothetical protein
LAPENAESETGRGFAGCFFAAYGKDDRHF